MDPVHSSSVTIYHEKQHLLMCGVHAVNNLLQYEHGPHFSPSDFDQLCRTLQEDQLVETGPDSGGWLFNSYRTPLVGRYDVSVLIKALASRGLQLDFWSGSDPSTLDLTGVVGLLLNEKQSLLMGLGSMRHWIALRPIGGKWYNLDSKLPAPSEFATSDAVVEFLRDQRQRDTLIMTARRTPT
eukprot:TRINITY_DN28462_c0_g1_i1.p1 TRINITY_DN28462_c0_g1~~TRINITY_DN28462_c0_g1_i1.p1  ORF type:complete len:183 (+),score=61.96 TRINITY_DN28462_c0_g1_i1:130-678(+)